MAVTVTISYTGTYPAAAKITVADSDDVGDITSKYERLMMNKDTVFTIHGTTKKTIVNKENVTQIDIELGDKQDEN